MTGRDLREWRLAQARLRMDRPGAGQEMSQRELATVVGVCLRTVCYWESRYYDQELPTDLTLRDIVRLLGQYRDDHSLHQREQKRMVAHVALG